MILKRDRALCIVVAVVALLMLGCSLVAGHFTAEADVPKHWRDTDTINAQYIRALHRIEPLTASRFKLPRNQRDIPPPSFECDVCMAIAPAIIDLVANATENQDLEVLLHDLCAKMTNNTEPQLGICDGLSEVILGLGQGVLAELEHFHFNLTMIVCADIAKMCIAPCCETPGAPEQIHISFASGGNVVGDNVPVRVAWATLRAQPNPLVQYRVAGSNATWAVANASISTYTHDGWRGILYNAVLTGLVQDTTYEYRVGSLISAAANAMSDVISFKTLPPNIGTAARPLKVVTLADMGYSEHSTATVMRMTALVDAGEVDLIVHTGDLSYSDMDAMRWDVYMRKMQPVISRVFYMTGVGNHEATFGSNFTQYKHRLVTPAPGDGAPSDALYYAVSAGRVRFVMLDSETPFQLPRMDDTQLLWLQKQLDAANTNGEFIFVGMHRPMYCSNPHMDCGVFADFFREKLEMKLRAAGASLVHVGHMHDYERTWPVMGGVVTANNYTNPPSPFTIVNGAAGCIEGVSEFAATQPAWSAFRTDAVGFMTMTFTAIGSRRIVNASFIQSSTNRVLDNFVVDQVVS